MKLSYGVSVRKKILKAYFLCNYLSFCDIHELSVKEIMG